MRLSYLYSMAALVSPFLHAAADEIDWTVAGPPTKFDDVEVPAMKVLRGDTIKDTIATGHW